MNEFDIFKDSSLGTYQVRTKTISFTIDFDDEIKENIFLDIVAILKESKKYSLSKIRKRLENKYATEEIMEVLYALNDNFLLPMELSLNITEFIAKDSTGQKPELNISTNYQNVNTCYLLVIGSSPVAKHMISQAEEMGFKNIKLLSFTSSDTEIDARILQADFVLVDADEWSPYHIDLINKSALEHNKPWLYVSGIEEEYIKIGPLFYGRETGCYNCLTSRIKSNHEYPEYYESYEKYLKGIKKPSKPDLRLIHKETLQKITADIALMEVAKFIEGWAIPSTWRTIIKYDYFRSEITKHTLLKKPYCEVCKPGLEYSPAPWLEAITIK